MPKLPILMYHSVSSNLEESKDLTIAVSKLEEQFAYLKENGYQSLHFKDIQTIKGASGFPKKAVIITFDDVYVNQLELAYPLLNKYKFKACFYVPFKYVNGTDSWNTDDENIMSVAQLKSLDPEVIELGMHSFSHKKYHEMSVEEIQSDFDLCKEFIVENKLEVHNTLAYPYGKYPRKGVEKEQFFDLLQKNQIAYGLRIGNRVNRFPLKNNYEIQRLDIKGEDSLATFKRKLKFGKMLF
ncbi:polysaccharide deacetylase family protein [Xanthomarina sp. F2636L]|uniref:polysaccharide deacetylase family protein n=1 Tax=Xanthomarina sp. F2636L TaxID=2996018 RepID=UPI00225DF3A3|nr:polysaccharide deacetylase family protein [Xanthomarina sp. F2636L]MCX7549981.1 polysaccharide deacetylase family protein [Xanthomarina sp. F2636L]